METKGHARLLFSMEEYKRRYDLIMERMHQAGLDAILVRNPENICYLTGYETPGHYNYHGLLLSSDEPVFILRLFEEANVSEFSWLARTVTIEDHEHPAEVVARTIDQMGLASARIGFEKGMNKAGLYCSVEEWDILRSALPKAAFVETTMLVAGVRIVKSEEEIAVLREAARIAETATQAGIDTIRDGITENEIAAEVYRVAILNGSEYMSLPPFILSGERTHLPHGTWRGRSVHAGDHVYFEVSAVKYRYTAAVMRCVSVGEPNRRVLKLAEVSIDALEAGMTAIRPGVTGESVNNAIMDVVNKAGFGGEHFTHHAGYSIGISFPPGWGEGHIMDIRRGEVRKLEPNMTFHIVPLIIDREIGVGFSALARVTGTGCEPLTKYPRSLTVI